MLVSIIIPVYNREFIIGETLKSLEAQTCQNFEVILVDNESSDNTLEVVKGFEKRLNMKTVTARREGFNVSAVRNTGLLQAEGELIILLDSDIVVSPGFVEAHVKCQEEREQVVIGYVYANHPNYSADFLNQCVSQCGTLQALFNHETFCRESVDIRDKVFYLDGDYTNPPAPWALFWTGNVSFTKNALIQAGLFDEEFQSWGMEDIDCGYRLFKTGIPLVFSSEAKGFHYPHPRNNDGNFLANHNNKYLFFEKHKNIITEIYLISKATAFNNTLKEVLDTVAEDRYETEIEIPQKGTGRGILLGANKKLMEQHTFYRVYEPNPLICQKIKKDFPHVEVVPFLGLFTDLFDGEMDWAIINEQRWGKELGTFLLKEAERVSGSSITITEEVSLELC